MNPNIRLVVRGQLADDDNPIPVVLTPAPTGSTATPVSGVKAPAATGTPEALAATETLVHQVFIRAGRTGRVANAGSVWLGTSATNDAQQYELLPGEWISFTAPPGKSIDLALLYVDAVTLTDGVIFIGHL